MRSTAVGTLFKVRAIAGQHVVVLAWDFKRQPAVKVRPVVQIPKRFRDLLGFSIQREELNADGDVVERRVLRGIKRFRDKDKGVPAGVPVLLSEHPVQSFLWADYTAFPGRKYRYTVTPVHGSPKLLDLRSADQTTVEVTTEVNRGDTHDIWFNRGVIGSQAYAREFDNRAPDPSNPHSDEMVWLSRGLYEALLAFVGRASSPEFGLRAAVYEFHYQPVAAAFRVAVDLGADVKIVYDDESTYAEENRATLEAVGLLGTDVDIGRTVTEGIRHNKFIVLLKDDKPIAVWTGSTNISDGGIFGHSNVGHAVWDDDIAAAYLEYWKRLEGNLTPSKLREPNRAASPLPVGPTPPDSVTPLFSPRDPKNDTTTIDWYAARMADAQELVCFTAAFGIDPAFQAVLAVESDVLRYVVKDDDLAATENIGVDHDVLFAAGGRFDEGALANFRFERGNPLNVNDYIHTKFMLVDPLSDDPLVVTGSANFSIPSQVNNDENMLVIRGDTRVADIYFGEFMRIFDHHYARYIVKKLKGLGTGSPDAGYLKETAAEWLPSQFDPFSYKSKRRRQFVGP